MEPFKELIGLVKVTRLGLAQVQEVLVLVLQVGLLRLHLAVQHHVKQVPLPQKHPSKRSEHSLYGHFFRPLRRQQHTQMSHSKHLLLLALVVAHCCLVVAAVGPTEPLHRFPELAVAEVQDHSLGNVGDNVFFVVHGFPPEVLGVRSGGAGLG